MRTFKEYLDSKGMTLIELLAAIVILGIIFTVFLSFFSQSMLFSAKVEDKLSGVNIAERILYEVKNAGRIKEVNKSCNDPSLTKLSGKQVGLSEDYYAVNNKMYYPEITICQIEDEKTLNLYRIHVEMYDDNPDNPKFLSEIFDYIHLPN